MTERRALQEGQRFGVWKAWSGNCFWCGEPVRYQNCEIDHVIPLDAVKNGKAIVVREQFSLPATFDFDSFDNWVPAHNGCNRKKGALLVNPSPAVSLHLAQIKAKKSLAMATAEQVATNYKKSALLGKLRVAISAGEITEEDIKYLWSGLPVPAKKEGTVGFLQQERLQIAPGWEVTQINGSLQHVTSKNGRFGITSTSDHPSWRCSQCSQKGPWNGVICLNCGNREEPD